MQTKADQTGMTFIVAAIGLSATVWDIGFNLGVYNTIFFDRILLVWVVSTAIVLASLLVPAHQSPLRWPGLLVLILPSLWLVLRILDDTSTSGQPIDSIILGVGFLVWLISLPYVGYVFLSITNPDILHLTVRFLVCLAGIVLIMGCLGYVLGKNNPLILSCYDFNISGNNVPANCAKSDQDLIVP